MDEKQYTPGQKVWVLIEGEGSVECEYYRRTFGGGNEVKRNGAILWGAWSDDEITDIPPPPAQKPTPPITAPSTPVSVSLAALSDTDLKARCEAAWSHLFVYLDELRRRAGIVVQSEEIPF